MKDCLFAADACVTEHSTDYFMKFFHMFFVVLFVISVISVVSLVLTDSNIYWFLWLCARRISFLNVWVNLLLCLMVTKCDVDIFVNYTSIFKIAALFCWQVWPLAKFRMEFTAENLERAVLQFYHTDATMQAHAHQWLTAAQTSPEAWCFVWELLHPSKAI